MLLELRIDNLLIVESACLEMGPGLTVITGETGAGKSLLLDALDLLLGRRADPALVGPKSDALNVSAVFSLPKSILSAIADGHGIPTHESELIVRRRVMRAGRSQAWINDTPVSVKALREVAGSLVELRSQNDQLRLGDPVHQLRMLDRFGGLEDAAGAYAQAHQLLVGLKQEWDDLERNGDDSIRELAFARFQLQEIEALQPEVGECQRLEQRHELLAGAQEWRDLSTEVVQILSESDQALIPEVSRLARRLEGAPYELLREAAQACVDAQESLNEVSRVCSQAADSLQADPRELHEVECRLAVFVDVMRKHGGTEETLLAAWTQLSERVALIEGADNRRNALREMITGAEVKRQVLGEKLATERLKAAKRLGQKAGKELAELGMPKAQLSMGSRALAAPTVDDFTGQELYLQTNPGLPAGPLGKVPSGGETSRLSLALSIALVGDAKGVTGSQAEAILMVPVMIFDEIDAGVGGRLGASLADKLHQLGSGRTVLAISHTPQMAARAAFHYHVVKEQGTDYTKVLVSRLEAGQREEEIAEMFGGGPEALKQARVLLNNAP